MSFDVYALRKEFPFFSEYKDLAYLDNGATSQRPQKVIDAVNEFYQKYNANPFRGLYDLSVEATDRYEAARRKAARFINADSENEIVFVRNATEALNLAAFSLGEMCVKEGDEIIISVCEHHSNMLPWRHMADRKKATVKYLFCKEDGSFSLDELKTLLTDKTKILAVTAMSNIFGRINDIKSMAELVHEKNAYIVADGSQSVPHSHTDVKALDCDFLAFSGHKMLGPMGIGVLYGKSRLLENMPPFLTGGEMIENVSLEEVTYAGIPHKFEAGTVNAGGAVGLAKAIDIIDDIGMDNIIKHEEALTRIAFEGLSDIPHVHILGSDDYKDHNGIITFKIDNVHPHDVSQILADNDIAVRAGHHCEEPLHRYLNIPSTTRASLMFYNTEEEIRRFIDCVKEIRPLMGFRD